jgi:hypothetical protein
MEPVTSSLSGACFAPLPLFKSATVPTTTITVAAKLSSVLPLRFSQGTAKRFRIVRPPHPRTPNGNR